jgi:hypothetical protein
MDFIDSITGRLDRPDEEACATKLAVVRMAYLEVPADNFRR